MKPLPLTYTVHPTNYEYNSLLVVFSYDLAVVDFTHTFQGYFASTRTILSQCKWSNAKEYG